MSSCEVALKGFDRCTLQDGEELLTKQYKTYTIVGFPTIDTRRVSRTHTFTVSKQKLFEDDRRQIVLGQSPERYAGDDAVVDKAQRCASTILAGECPVYVVGMHVVTGEQKIIHRNILVNFPDRYIV